ncbi:MAG: sensor histidine kinase [Calditrichia bacterium]|nr:sensor histidine kinase [Calditrichia bacterium]
MRRIFTNLISNAIKYNREEGKLEIEVKKVGNQAKIKISDTGIGMKQEDVELLFQEFFRTINKHTRNIS